MDEQLKQLINIACECSPGSAEWRRAMHRLLIAIQKLPGLYKSSHPNYLHALDQTFEKISRDICTEFKPRSNSLTKDLVNWINGELKWRIKDLYIKDIKIQNKEDSLDRPISTSNEGKTALGEFIASPTLDGLDGYIEKLQYQKTKKIVLDLKNYLRQDPQDKLKNCYPRSYPDCDCQFLSQKRFLTDHPDTFQNIAKELNMPLRPLTNHWFGRCLPLLQKMAEDLGYYPQEKL